MPQAVDHRVAQRAAPYGLALVPETDQSVNERNLEHERAVQQRWQRLCEWHGAAILGVRDVPTSPVRAQLEGQLWDLTRLGPGEHVVPRDVFHRARALEAAGVPFAYWLWGEELPQRPLERPRAAPSPWPIKVSRTAAQAFTWADTTTKVDPLLIGVIETAPGRGLWVLLGRWDH